MKVLPLFLILLLLLPVMHPCRGAVVCGDEAIAMASCDAEKDDCCTADAAHHTNDSDVPTNVVAFAVLP